MPYKNVSASKRALYKARAARALVTRRANEAQRLSGLPVKGLEKESNVETDVESTNAGVSKFESYPNAVQY